MPPLNSSTHTPRIVGLGEVLWDLLPAGRQLGGAPANFAYHAAALGARAGVVSRVGTDDLGRETLDRLRHLGLDVEGVELDPRHPTGTVGVELAADGQPKFTIHENVAWDALEGSPAGRQAVETADAIGFGTLAQRGPTTRATLQALLARARPDALRVFDVNLRQHFYSRDILEASFRLAHVAKVNDTELLRLAELFQLPGDDRSRLAALAERFDLRAIVCTRGAQGSLLLVRGQWSELPGQPVRVADTIGAGDSFTAALTLGLLYGWPLDTLHRRAADVAAYVCSQPGATPPLPESLVALFRPRSGDSSPRD